MNWMDVVEEIRVEQDWIGRNVVILGAARQGLSLAAYLLRHGAWVVLNDRKSETELAAARKSLTSALDVEEQKRLTWIFAGHPLSLLDTADLICISGGVPLNLPVIQEAQARGIPFSNDSQIFLQAAPCKVIGITGSAGKTTTTTLVGRMAQAAVQDARGSAGSLRQVWVGGNIGSPLIADVDRMQANDLAVMELSSFQLEQMDRSPQVAAILNITPNHLDRHGTMQAYTAAKRRILDFQGPTDIAVLGRHDPGAWSLAGQVTGRLLSFGIDELPAGQEGTTVRSGQVFLSEVADSIMPVSDIKLRGQHNLLNVLAACAIAWGAGLPAGTMRQGVQGFYGVAHRLQFVRSWGGADWYNDSIATAPERAMAAIRAFDEPLVLLAGGRDKDLPWQDFAELALQRVDHLLVFGEAAEKILQAVESVSAQPGFVNTKLSLDRCAGLRQAVEQAARLVEPGDVVLLSPGGTSFDEFRDFEERGECFVELVNHLA
jgi:UDP-N-acetylmuramoylalanine--D-glutamate ligase